MKLAILAVGNRMPRHVEDAFAEYAKRMPPELALDLKEIKPEPRSHSKTAETVMRLEAERIQAALPRGALVVALDERGRDLTTRELAEMVRAWMQNGQDIAFVIGGADGLDPAVKNAAALKIRLSSLTLPHGLVRVILAEQLYRAWSILANHPYHRV
jgi:23S rRNA (pseudouridine1915-N3)-methyltransferase